MSGSPTRNVVRNQGPIILFVLLTMIGSAVIWLGKVWNFDIALIGDPGRNDVPVHGREHACWSPCPQRASR